jgi:hypothetical protein
LAPTVGSRTAGVFPNTACLRLLLLLLVLLPLLL